jgi:hypothetical protein
MSNIKTPSQEKTKDEPGASVDEQVDDSFPASDPPSYNAGGRVGHPDRAKADQAPTEEKPKTERASHQGGGGVRSDHKPQGPGTEK